MRSARQLVGAALFFLSATMSWSAWAAEQGGHNNMTQALAGRADYSLLASYLVKTGVAYEIDSRSSITVLAASNKILLPVVQQHPISAVADILRYHVLLQYLDSAQLHGAATTTTVTTLYQTTGRAAGDGGILDVALEADGSVSVGQRGQAVRTARILQPISANPYNLTVWDVSEVMLPPGLAQASDAPLNLTDVLRRAGSFTTVVALLQATGLEQELQARLGASGDAAAGLTLLLPDDAVFARTFTPAQMERLSLEQKAALVRYHGLPAYYPLDYFRLLDSTTVLATLATSSPGPSQADYLLSVTSSAGKVFVGTGIVSAGLGERAVYQNYPAAVLSVDNVLLPKEVFASFPPASPPDTASSPSIAATPTSLPDTAPAPAASPPWPPAPTPSPAAAAATAPDAPPPASSPAPAKAAPSKSPKSSSAPGPAPPHRSVAPAAGPGRGGFGTGPSEAQVGAAAGHFSLVAALALSSSACATTWLFFFL